MKAAKSLFWLSVVMVVLSGTLIVAMPLGLEKYLRHNGWTLSSTWLTYGAVIAIQLVFAGIVAVMAFQTFKKSRVIQDLRFFAHSTIIDEEARETYARFGLEEGSRRKKLAELAMEAETMNRVVAMTKEVQDAIAKRARYASIAEYLGFKLTKA